MPPYPCGYPSGFLSRRSSCPLAALPWSVLTQGCEECPRSPLQGIALGSQKPELMRALRCWLGIVLSCLAGWALESPWSVTASARSPRTGPFPIRVSVVIVNHTRQPTSEATVTLLMEPRIPYGTRPRGEGPHIWDPVTMEEEVPALQPGQQHQVVFPTPYFSSSQVIDQRSSFTANNLGPTITTQTQVDFRVWVKPNQD